MSHTKIKELALAGVAAVSSIAALWIWHATLPSVIAGDFRDVVGFTLAFLGLVLGGMLFALAAVFIKDEWVAYPSVIAGIAIPFFFIPASNAVAVALVAAIFLISFATDRIRKEYSLSLGFSLLKILRTGLPLYFTVIAVVVSMYYFAALEEARIIENIFPRPAFDMTLRLLPERLRSIANIPDLQSDSNVDETLAGFVLEQLAKEGVDVSKIPQSELERMVREQKAALSKQFDVKLSGSEKIGDVFYNAIASQIEHIAGPYRQYLPVAAVIAFFLAFKAATWPLYYLTILVVYIAVKLLIATKIITRETEKIEVEKLAL